MIASLNPGWILLRKGQDCKTFVFYHFPKFRKAILLRKIPFDFQMHKACSS